MVFLSRSFNPELGHCLSTGKVVSVDGNIVTTAVLGLCVYQNNFYCNGLVSFVRM